jgi:8-amino-7-oxononanoate synthase/acyl carrier protein
MSATVPSIEKVKQLDLSNILPTDAPANHLVDRLQHWANLRPNFDAFYFTDGETDDDLSMTYAQLDHAARAVAVELRKDAQPGDRVILMYPPGLDFVIGYFGCLYAGCVAVPAFPPKRNRKGMRIQNIAQDCGARIGLSTAATNAQMLKDEGTESETRQLKLISTDQIDKTLAIQFRPVEIAPDDLAMLQYTSGSTGQPKGVMLTHDNLIRNCEMITYLFNLRAGSTGVSWLPAYHDMGLIGGILTPVFLGVTIVLMSPMSFLQRPVRWLRALSKFKGTVSGAPNFAYQLCVDKVTDEEMKDLDLSHWTVAFNGAEPVRASTMEQFTRKFERVGFRQTSHLPTYGMAETTLIVTAGPGTSEPVVRHFSGKLMDKRIVESIDPNDPDARALVGCGRVAPNETVLIVDGDKQNVLADDEIGEIWINSPSVGKGYWQKAEITRDTFEAYTADGQGPFLRTGDLGFFHEGQLFVAGRVKDLIIVRGVNRYPQDIEQTIEECHESIQSGSAAAFADSNGTRERLIIAVEVQRSLEEDWSPVIEAIRRSIVQVHELPADAVVLVRAGSLPKTSSGKIQRHACLMAFREKSLRVIAQWIGWEDNETDEGPMIAASTVKSAPAFTQHRAVTSKKTRDPDPAIVDLVKRTVRHVAEERAKILDLDTNIVVDLGLDSLERLQIAHALETSFGGRFPEEVLNEIETVREIAEALEQHFGKDKMRADIPDHFDEETVLEREVQPADYQFDQLPEYRRLRRTIEQFALTGLPNPYFTVHQGLTRDTTTIDGKSYISFASYNYIGTSGDPFVTESVVNAVKQYGTSVSASRLVSGEKPLHRQLETTLADWIGVDDSVVFVGGHSTNESVIGHLVDEKDLILHDALSHNSIVQGALLSGARRRAFPHNDWQELSNLLERSRKRYRRVLVIIEGVYSMDGDYPDLPKFVELTRKHNAWLMVDEAHSIGTMGSHGRGISEHFGINPREVDIWMGTLSKSFGSCGGYIAGSHALVEYLKYTTPGFVFSVGLSPPNAAAALASLTLLKREPQRVTRLHEASRLFLHEAKRLGLNTGDSGDTPVIPVITGNSLHALQLSRRLFEQGINVQPILYPAVEESAARLRFFINSTHTNQQIMCAAQLVAENLKKITPEAFR